jgi:hypothetical protein
VPIGSSWGIQGWNLLNFLRNEPLYDYTAPAGRTSSGATRFESHGDMRRKICKVKTFNEFQPEAPAPAGEFGIPDLAARIASESSARYPPAGFRQPMHDFSQANPLGESLHPQIPSPAPPAPGRTGHGGESFGRGILETLPTARHNDKVTRGQGDSPTRQRPTVRPERPPGIMPGGMSKNRGAAADKANGLEAELPTPLSENEPRFTNYDSPALRPVSFPQGSSGNPL